MRPINLVGRPVIQRSRHAVIRRIQALMRPHLHESGYMTGPIGSGRHLKLWVETKDGKITRREFKLRGSFTIQEFSGITEYGIIVDCAGGCIMTREFGAIPYEDLLKLFDWVRHYFSASISNTRPTQDPHHAQD